MVDLSELDTAALAQRLSLALDALEARLVAAPTELDAFAASLAEPVRALCAAAMEASG